MDRLNKVLARAGIASRRGADDLIEAGRVSVNGRIVREHGTLVDPVEDDVRVDGERIGQSPAPRYVALHKPRHVITTRNDPGGRTTVSDLVPAEWQLFPVGRLDYGSEGLLLMTNDGDLAHKLTHPRFEHEKEYRVKISGTPTDTALSKWREGMYLEDGKTLPATVRIESSTGSGTWLRFVLREGRNRQIRRMVEEMHHSVHRILRMRVGTMTLGDLAPGEWRELTEEEVAALLDPEAAAEAAAREVGDARKKTKYKRGWARPKPKKKRLGKRSRKRRGAKTTRSRRGRR